MDASEKYQRFGSVWATENPYVTAALASVDDRERWIEAAMGPMYGKHAKRHDALFVGRRMNNYPLGFEGPCRYLWLNRSA